METLSMKKITFIFVLVLISAVCIFAENSQQYILNFLEEFELDEYSMVTQYFAADIYQNDVLYQKIDTSRYFNGLSDFEKLLMLDDAIYDITLDYSKMFGIAYSLTAANHDIKYSALYITPTTTLVIPHTETFLTREIAGAIPETMHTYRFNTFVNTNQSAKTQVDGIYGLLNEMNAYYHWFVVSGYRLEYLYNNDGTPGEYIQIMREIYNQAFAFKELKYYSVMYLQYAKEHHPEIYKELLNNRVFCRAYGVIINYWDSWSSDCGSGVTSIQRLLHDNYGINYIKRDDDILFTTKNGTQYIVRTFQQQYLAIENELDQIKAFQILSEIDNNAE